MHGVTASSRRTSVTDVSLIARVRAHARDEIPRGSRTFRSLRAASRSALSSLQERDPPPPTMAKPGASRERDFQGASLSASECRCEPTVPTFRQGTFGQSQPRRPTQRDAKLMRTDLEAWRTWHERFDGADLNGFATSGRESQGAKLLTARSTGPISERRFSNGGDPRTAKLVRVDPSARRPAPTTFSQVDLRDRTRGVTSGREPLRVPAR